MSGAARAASGGHLLQQQQAIVHTHLQTLRNDDLKTICRTFDQPVSGNKLALVSRCQRALDDIVRRGDVADFEDLKWRAGIRSLPSVTSSNHSNGSEQYGMVQQRSAGGSLGRSTGGTKNFKPSPFYQILDTLLPSHDLPDAPEMPNNRNTVKSNLVIKADLGQRLRGDATLKILLFCRDARDSFPTVDIKFPSQIELKVNNNDVKHNFKGLKNKPGSTKPVDLTSFLNKFGERENTIQITYALTRDRYSYTVFLAQYVNADKLIERLRNGNVITKDRVLREMNRANRDADIVATSEHMSLKDPISTVRISLPVRSSHCTHYQCFDAAMFLQLQEQAPQWTCPTCNKNVSFESLCVDQYFEDILRRTARTVEKVAVQPDGVWTIIKEDDDDEQPDGRSKARASYDDDFDDSVDLEEPPKKATNEVKRESFLASTSPTLLAPVSIHTPPLSSREPSVAQSTSSAQRSGHKRPQSAVIDLTLSDDEDEQPPRAAKRQSTIQNHRPTPTTATTSNPTHIPSFHLPTSAPDSRPALPRPSYSLGQNGANAYRSSNNAATTTSQRPAYASASNLAIPQSPMSPPNPSASPFSVHSNSPVWSSPFARPPLPSGQQAQHQQSRPSSQLPPQQQQQRPTSSTFPPRNPSFPLRPPSTSSPAPSQNQSQFQPPNTSFNFENSSGLRLPPLQTVYQPPQQEQQQQRQQYSTSTSSTTASASSTSAQQQSDPNSTDRDLFQGWRTSGIAADADAFDWGDFGSYDSSPGG